MANCSFNKEDFLGLIEGDKDLFKSLLDLFEEDSPQILLKLEAALAGGDIKTAEQMAHRLKGNLRNFYAEEASDMAQKIEESARENKLDEVQQDISALKELITVFLKDINIYYDSL